MKKSIISEILNGERSDIKKRLPDEYYDNKKNVLELFRELQAQLEPDLLKSHIKLLDELSFAHCDELDFYYIEGFKLGLLAGIECTDE